MYEFRRERLDLVSFIGGGSRALIGVGYLFREGIQKYVGQKLALRFDNRIAAAGLIKLSKCQEVDRLGAYLWTRSSVVGAKSIRKLRCGRHLHHPGKGRKQYLRRFNHQSFLSRIVQRSDSCTIRDCVEKPCRTPTSVACMGSLPRPIRPEPN